MRNLHQNDDATQHDLLDALHGATRHDHNDNAVNLANGIKVLKQHKDMVNKVLTLVLQQKEECIEAHIAAMVMTITTIHGLVRLLPMD
jgi:hypothetical protein